MPKTRVGDAADSVARATEDLARAEERVAAAEAHEVAMHQAHRDAQEQLAEAAMRRRGVRDCIAELGGIRTEDAIATDAEAEARAAAGRSEHARARLAHARQGVTSARGSQQSARQTLLQAQQLEYAQAHHPQLIEQLHIVRGDMEEENLGESERARRHARSRRLSDEIRVLAEAAGVV